MRTYQKEMLVTPWRDQAELLEVRTALFSWKNGDDHDGYRAHAAVERVQAWRLRGGVPHAVDSTANLVSAQLHARDLSTAPFSVQASFSTAFCRFVTGYCDITAQGKVRRSMASVAKTLAMPASWVELRHETAHGRLPALPRLERATREALVWLWTNYWADLGEVVDGVPDKASVEQSPLKSHAFRPSTPLGSVLSTYIKQRISEIKSRVSVHEPTSATATATLEIVKSCRGRLDALRYLAISMLQPKMLVPTDRKPGESLSGAYLIWTPLVRSLAFCQIAFIPCLLKAMIAILTEPANLHPPPDVFRAALCEWVTYIVTHIGRTNHASLPAQWRRLVVEECTMTPSTVWTGQLVRDLVDESGSERFIQRWQPYFDAFIP